jgi:hypothetical protein
MGAVMSIFDASAPNDNDETLAYLRIILAGSKGSTRAQQSRRGPLEVTSLAQPQSRRFVGIPLIVGVAVSITIRAPSGSPFQRRNLHGCLSRYDLPAPARGRSNRPRAGPKRSGAGPSRHDTAPALLEPFSVKWIRFSASTMNSPKEEAS